MNQSREPCGCQRRPVAAIFASYPEPIQHKLRTLRRLILKVATTSNLGAVEETLKWGEPSYLVRGGSTIRLAWKAATPKQYAMLFLCQSQLIPTFKALYPDVLGFAGNRAIVFTEGDELPIDVLSHCVSLALTYHRRKHIPLLGARE